MYEYKTLNRNIKKETPLFECLNAIGILENVSYKQMFDSFIDVLHIYANGPSEDDKNIQCILKEHGYSLCEDRKKFKGYALVKRGNHFYAFIQKGTNPIQYGIVNPIYIQTCKDYEIYIKDYNYLYHYQKRWNQLPNKVQQASFNYRNLNPHGKYVGDCSIRAIAYALQIDWHTALDRLAAQAYKMHLLHVNHKDVVEKVLSKEDFSFYKRFPGKITCKEFCKRMDTMFEDEIIVLYAGDYHITALSKKNHHYTIQDSWDCSNEIAGDYFVKKKYTKHAVNYIEKVVLHPTYGEGIIYDQQENKLHISFNEKDCILLLEWVEKNCQIL